MLGVRVIGVGGGAMRKESETAPGVGNRVGEALRRSEGVKARPQERAQRQALCHGPRPKGKQGSSSGLLFWWALRQTDTQRASLGHIGLIFQKRALSFAQENPGEHDTGTDHTVMNSTLIFQTLLCFGPPTSKIPGSSI